MKRLYLYVVDPFHDHGHIFVCAMDYFCKSHAELQRRATALEKCLNVNPVKSNTYDTYRVDEFLHDKTFYLFSKNEQTASCKETNDKETGT